MIRLEPIPLLVCLFLAIVPASSLTQDVVSGYVRDSHTLEPLTGANVVLPGLRKGTSTDSDGFFRIGGMLPYRVNVKISYIGYGDTLLSMPLSDFKDLIVLLEPDSVEMESVVVTATRITQSISDIPQRVEKIDGENIKGYPATNTDNILKMIPGINVNRSWGIFSRNASVTMRGMPGSSRSLILLDGVPLNKTAGGTVSWHLVTPEEIERIEVVKGPGSTIYGNNAMGGVINILTKQPQKRLSGFAGIGYGTYNTYKAQVNVSGNQLKEAKGLFWKFGGFYRQGDGYILEPGEIRDTINTEAYLFEGNANGLLGYRFSSHSMVEIDFRHYQDKRGSGVKVYEDDGSYESFTNNNLTIAYEGQVGRFSLNAKSFYFREEYFRQSEAINSSGEYKLVDTEADKDDYGLWLTMAGALGRAHRLTTGLDLKNGSLDNREVYRTSTDEVRTRGNLMFSALFVQDEISLKDGKLKVVAGLRLDHARYYNGQLSVKDPTSKTGFPGTFAETFPQNSWIRLSPKLAFNYRMLPHLRTFLNASTGFMPPRLDDLAGSRKIRRGFKIANPDLVPETLWTIEWGVDWTVFDKLEIEPSVFYSRGNDFQYLVATGEYLDSESEEPVPVYQRQNVSEVEVAGAELGVRYPFTRQLVMNAAYTYNYSKIRDYQSMGDPNLTGKYLNEVPENMVYLGLSWKNKVLDVFIDYSFTDEQWFDEENTEVIESYSVVNVRLSRKIVKGLMVSLDIQDLLNEQFIDRKGYLSPGRFIMFEIRYAFNK